MTDELDAATLCRRIIRDADRAALATTAARGKGGVGGPWPYASLVLVAVEVEKALVRRRWLYSEYATA